MSYVAWLHQGKLPRELVGGKGASLSGLLAAGFTVPPGFCLTADAYRQFMAATGLDDAVRQTLAGADLSTPAGVASAAKAVTARILAAELPAALREEVARAYEGLCAMAGLACAVRSSAIAEDGSAASFAGLYESYLNVQGTNDVLDAVRRCYASLWSERALAYRLRRGGAAVESMAVVVMGLVPCQTAGIAFTAHPVSGALDQVVINASFGLGEAIVSGRVTPDAFVVRKQPLQVIEREIYAKELAVYPHPDGGGTIERRLTPDQASLPSLSDEQAQEVARTAIRVEQHYGCPQDVEWGLAAGQIYLLQSRPITTLG